MIDMATSPQSYCWLSVEPHYRLYVHQQLSKGSTDIRIKATPSLLVYVVPVAFLDRPTSVMSYQCFVICVTAHNSRAETLE